MFCHKKIKLNSLFVVEDFKDEIKKLSYLIIF